MLRGEIAAAGDECGDMINRQQEMVVRRHDYGFNIATAADVKTAPVVGGRGEGAIKAKSPFCAGYFEEGAIRLSEGNGKGEVLAPRVYASASIEVSKSSCQVASQRTISLMSPLRK